MGIPRSSFHKYTCVWNAEALKQVCDFVAKAKWGRRISLSQIPIFLKLLTMEPNWSGRSN